MYKYFMSIATSTLMENTYWTGTFEGKFGSCDYSALVMEIQ
jgi:hypothetical protein